MRAVFLKGLSAYGATRLFIDEAAAAFARKGHDSVVIDCAQSSQAENLAALEEVARTRPVDLVYSIGIYGEARDDQGRSVGQIAAAPHVVHYVDYPLTHHDRIDRTDSACALLVVDESHVDAVKTVWGNERFAHVGFCPHAAIGDAAAAEPDAKTFAAERSIPILFAATFYRPAKPWQQTPNVLARRICEAAFDIAMGGEYVPALEAMERSMVAHGLDPKNPVLAPLRRASFMVHEEVRMARRLLLLKSAAHIGLPLHVYGAGYEKQLCRFKSVIFHGEVSLPEIVAKMRQSRTVLNANANFGQGSHERALCAMRAGAVAISDHSTFYETQFQAGDAIAFYRWQSLDRDLAAIGALIEDSERCFRMARAGTEIVRARHLWDHRVDTIIAAAASAKARHAAWADTGAPILRKRAQNLMPFAGSEASIAMTAPV